MEYGNHKIGNKYKREGAVREVIALIEDGRWVKCRTKFASGRGIIATYFWNDAKLLEAEKI